MISPVVCPYQKRIRTFWVFNVKTTSNYVHKKLMTQKYLYTTNYPCFGDSQLYFGMHLLVLDALHDKILSKFLQ
jgi:hypothetical protein